MSTNTENIRDKSPHVYVHMYVCFDFTKSSAFDYSQTQTTSTFEQIEKNRTNVQKSFESELTTSRNRISWLDKRFARKKISEREEWKIRFRNVATFPHRCILISRIAAINATSFAISWPVVSQWENLCFLIERIKDRELELRQTGRAIFMARLSVNFTFQSKWTGPFCKPLSFPYFSELTDVVTLTRRKATSNKLENNIK